MIKGIGIRTQKTINRMKNLLWMLVGLMSLSFVSCEQNDLLLSEKKLNEKIQTTWKVLYSNNNDSHETWSFNEGNVTLRYKRPENGLDTIVTGKYQIDARFSKAYVKLSEFIFEKDTLPVGMGGTGFSGRTNSNFTATDLNRAWTIVVLDDKVLYLSATDNGGAIRSIEFIKD